jgi:hypothetical protein
VSEEAAESRVNVDYNRVSTMSRIRPSHRQTGPDCLY